MNTDSTIQHTSRKFMVHTVLSLLVAALGVAGVLYCAFVEDDPALVPLVLIAVGIAWFAIARARLRPKRGRDAIAS